MEAIGKRKSVRKYLNEEVEEGKFFTVLEAGRLAPSASNRQEWRFIIVKDQVSKKELSEAATTRALSPRLLS